MSISYTVGGKSRTYQAGRKLSNSAVTSPLNRGRNHLSSTLASGGPSPGAGLGEQRTGTSRSSRGHAVGVIGETRTGRSLHKSAAAAGSSTSSKTDRRAPTEDTSFQGNIVTLADLKVSNSGEESHNKTQRKRTDSQTHTHKSHRPAPDPASRIIAASGKPISKSNSTKLKQKAGSQNSFSGLGKKLGEVRVHPIPEEEPQYTPAKRVTNTDKKRTSASLHVEPASRSSKPKSLNVNQTAARTKTPSKVSTGKGTSPVGRGQKMANSGYGSSSRLYSSNPRPVGQRSQAGGTGDLSDSTSQAAQQGTPQQQQQQSEQYVPSGGYTMISPNERKRQQLTSRASQEQANYDKYKAAKKPFSIQGPAQTTGGSKSEEEARCKMERESRTKKYEQLLKREKYQKEKREREDREHDEKKAKARQQTHLNTQRQAEREESFLMNDHARTNEDFLQRLEGRQGATASFRSTSQDLQILTERFPRKDPAKLQKLLDQNDGDVNEVIDLLQ